MLSARGFIIRRGDGEYLTNAAVLLFAKNILKFNMNCRIRFIRIDGREMQVGDKYNVIKDKSIDEPILRLVDAAKSFITDQLRVFTRQDRESGRFIESPEYPEFPWYEGIINAVAHRDYAASGLFIKVSMYDDRLEIESPGRFPNIITADNIMYTRFSRNKTISRVMTEFEWVRELNEGVKKIYSDMDEAGLPEPEYIETPNTVRLILRNNIDERTAYRTKALNEALYGALKGYDNIWSQLDAVEKDILTYINNNGASSRVELEKHTQKSKYVIIRRLRKLTDIGILKVNGDPHSKARTYEIQDNNRS